MKMRSVTIAALAVALCAACMLEPTPAGARKGGICPVSYCGDTNDDGTVVASDALAVLRIAVGLPVRDDDCNVTIATGRAEREGVAVREDGLNEGICFARKPRQ